MLDIEFVVGGGGWWWVVLMVVLVGVQSHFHVKPNFGKVKLS